MLTYLWPEACFKHSNFFTVNDEAPVPDKLMTDTLTSRMKLKKVIHVFYNGQQINFRIPTTNGSNATALIYAIGAGITAAAGTRLALQLILDKGFKLFSFQLQNSKSSALLFIVTTSLCQDWVIYAPAAFLGCGSRLSGSLSEIEPLFFVTRYRHGSPIHYHRKLIGQKLE